MLSEGDGDIQVNSGTYCYGQYCRIVLLGSTVADLLPFIAGLRLGDSWGIAGEAGSRPITGARRRKSLRICLISPKSPWALRGAFFSA